MDRLPTPVFLGFPYGSADKEPANNGGDLGSIPELGRSPGEGKGYPLQYSGLENSIDYVVYAVAELDTTERLSLKIDLHSRKPATEYAINLSSVKTSNSRLFL